MTVTTRTLRVSTRAGMHVVDLTDDVQRAIADAGVRDGLACVFCPGSTGGVTTVEYEPGLVEEDLPWLFDRLAPEAAERGEDYGHEKRWHDGNGHSHCRASLLGPSLTVPIVDGAPTLGTWQQVIFVDFDVPARERQLIVQIVGE